MLLLLPLLLSLLPLLLEGAIDDGLPLVELGLDFLEGAGGSLHPGVGEDLVESEPFGGVRLEHAGEHVLEVGREEVWVLLVLGVEGPEGVFLLPHDELVVGVVGGGLGRSSGKGGLLWKREGSRRT